jgi:Tfp pilus assembly protein PilN
MIRINLLAASKAKRKGGGGNPSSAPSMDVGSVGSPMMKILLVLVIAGAGNYVYYAQLNKEAKSIAIKMAAAEQKNRELADVKAQYLERQRQADGYKRRVDVIDKLRAGQAGPVDLMNTIGETINGTEAVWLSTMKDQGNSVAIEGMALSTDAVATLIKNLQNTGYFKNIEIKETYQDDSFKEMQAFQFTLTCEKTTKS